MGLGWGRMERRVQRCWSPGIQEQRAEEQCHHPLHETRIGPMASLTQDSKMADHQPRVSKRHRSTMKTRGSKCTSGPNTSVLSP